MPRAVQVINAFKQNITGGAFEALAAGTGDSFSVANYREGSRATIDEIWSSTKTSVAQFDIRSPRLHDNTRGAGLFERLSGVPVELHGVHFNPSQVDKGPGIYAVVDLTRLDTGERGMRHVGGYRPVAQLLWLWKRKRFPYKAELGEVAKAKPGQSAPLGIKRLTATG